MKLTKAVIILCCLFFLQLDLADAASTRTLKGVVMTPDGTVVPQFSVIVRHGTDKPELLQRRLFRNGEFTVDGLAPDKYLVQISAAQFVAVRLVVDFKTVARDTEYSIVILHPYRREARISADMAHSVSVKMLQQKIPGAAKDAYEKAVVHHREGKLDEALIEYGKALRNYPKYIAALTDLGTIFLLYNRPDSALAFLRRAEAEDDDDPIIQLNIAVALTEQGNYGGALKLLKNVLQREPRLAPAQYLSGRIHALQKKYDLAEQFLRQALELDPGMLDAAVLRINISIEQNDYAEARRELQRVREAMGNKLLARFIDEQLSSLGG